MASSQVEIASSSPFGYVLNNRCCGTSTRDSNSFNQNFKNLVQSHLHSCKAFPSDSCENSQNNVDLFECKKTEFGGKNQESCGGGVSSLVRKWKDIETDSKSLNLVHNYENLGFVCDESCSIVMKSECGWESDDKTDISKDSDSDVKESERLGVADIIKKLKFDNGANVVVAAAVNGGSPLPRVRTSSIKDHSEGQRCNFSPVLSSPRFIRGRQAFSDLLLQMERDRKRELEGLVERKAVSKFQQRGRIQVHFSPNIDCNLDSCCTILMLKQCLDIRYSSVCLLLLFTHFCFACLVRLFCTVEQLISSLKYLIFRQVKTRKKYEDVEYLIGMRSRYRLGFLMCIYIYIYIDSKDFAQL